MQGERFLDLYVSELREHLRFLVRDILRLEAGEVSAIEEAFRAAHTIKGLAAAMGHAVVAAEAHRLEDRLEGVRQSALVEAELADELLGRTDAIEAALERALAGTETALAAGSAVSRPPPRRAATEAAPAAVPAETATIAVVSFSPDVALPEARAEVVRRAATRVGAVLGAATNGEASAFELRLFLAASADLTAIERVVLRESDVTRVTFSTPSAAPPSPVPSEAGANGARLGASVRVDRDRLDELAEGIAELSVLQSRGSRAPEVAVDRAAAVLATLQRIVLEMRMVPFSTVSERLARVVRDAARAGTRAVDFRVEGGDIEIDQAVLDALIDPLVHLLRNAVDHGIEGGEERVAAGKPGRGTVRLGLHRELNSVRVEVADDGRGVSPEAVAARGRALGLLQSNDAVESEDVLRLLFHPGFSTAETVSELSGRGVGLDVVAARIRALGGAIEMTTRPGHGTTFTLRVPITLSLMHALRIRIGSEEYALPITHVAEVVTLDPATNGGVASGALRIRGEAVPLIDLGRVLGSAGEGEPGSAVVAGLGDRRVALAVHGVLGHEQIVVKPFDAPTGTLPVFSGATLLPDGRPALLIDPLSVL